MPSNQEMILKSIETSDFGNGGLLTPKRQNQFIKLIRTYGKMIPMVRFERLSQSQMTLDKMHIGEPISESVDENTGTVGGGGNTSKASTSQIDLQTKKLKSGWNITTETLTENIEQSGFENSVMDGMTQRIATDLELLAIQGDATTYSAATDVFGKLLKRCNGWDVLTQSAHILDVGGSSIQKGIFAEMVKMMPQQYLQDPDLKWWVSKAIAIDWMDLLSDRGTALGDNALNGNSISPYGIPLVQIPLIPDNKSVVTTSGTSAVVVGTRADTFELISGTNSAITLNIDGGGNKVLVVPTGTYTVGKLAALINAVSGLEGVASDDTHGRLVLRSPGVGAASTVKVVAVANDMYTEVGLTAATTTGVNAGNATTTKDASFIWLASPKNFIAAMRGTTRVYTKFNQDFDRLETVIYNEVTFAIENDDAIVKAVNLRKRNLI